MGLEQTARLPFFDDFAVQAQIRIQSVDKEYMAYIQTQGVWHRIRLGLQQHDAERLCAGLQQAMERVSTCCDEATDRADSTAYARALSDLAHKGNDALQGIFGEDVLEVMSRTLQPEAVVQVTSEDFFPPWDLLYDGPLGDHVDISGFWGMRYIISRTVIQPHRPGDLVSPLITSPRPRLGLIASDQWSHVVTQEIPVLNRLRRQKKIFLSSLGPLDSDQRDQGLDQCARFLRKNLQVVHLACGVRECELSGPSCLRISENFDITAEDVRATCFDLQHHPFVILNARFAEATNPLLSAAYWAAVFWECGTRGVLTAEFHVPDRFAAVLAETFYEHLLAGEPVGKALLNSRHDLWSKEGNPLGLGYALYSSPSIRISP